MKKLLFVLMLLFASFGTLSAFPKYVQGVQDEATLHFWYDEDVDRTYAVCTDNNDVPLSVELSLPSLYENSEEHDFWIEEMDDVSLFFFEEVGAEYYIYSPKTEVTEWYIYVPLDDNNYVMTYWFKSKN